MGPSVRIWVLTAALAGTAAILMLAVPDRRIVDPPFELPWPLLAVIAYLAEAQVIHLHIRRSAHSFSMSEVPLAAGLLLVSPMSLLVARLLGSAVALAVNRRQSPVKFAFNVAQFAASTAAALVVLHLVAQGDVTFGPLLWLAVLVAILADNLVGVLAVFLAISLAEGEWQTRRVREMLRIGTLVSMTNGSMALIGIAGAWERPEAAVLLVIPLVTAWLAYRAYVSQRQQNENLELLYESTRIFQRAPELDRAMTAVLDHARVMFKAERAEIYLLPSQRGDQVLLVSSTPGNGDAKVTKLGPTIDDPVLASSIAQRRAVRVAGMLPREVGPGGYRDALVAPLLGESALIGVMVVADRISAINPFDDTDLRLFELLASHTAVALENGQLEQSLTQVTELKEELHHQALHDSLTGLANRVLFSQALAQRLDLPDAHLVPAILFIDLDDFKLVNDTLGHAVGDQLLTAVGARIATCLRQGDMAARLGGDEFAVLLNDTPDLTLSRSVADRLVAALEPHFDIAGHDIRIRASIGIANSRQGAATADDAMRNADMAMYSAKAHGKGRSEVFDPGMHTAFAGRVQLTSELSRASLAQQFAVLYQPIIQLPEGRTAAVEALVRWDHPERGRLLPGTFIPAAEESEVILEIGRHVLGQACQRVEGWRRASGDDSFRVAVNVSARQLAVDTFAEDTLDIIRACGARPSSIVLELTESAMLDDYDTSHQKLSRLRDAGVGISVDDFGTGYSSLAYLQRLPLTTLKIASSFVGADNSDEQRWALAGAIVALGRALDLSVIAEGVETASQLERLMALGCEYAQGYYFSPAVDAAAVDAIFRDASAAAAGPRAARASLAPRTAARGSA